MWIRNGKWRKREGNDILRKLISRFYIRHCIKMNFSIKNFFRKCYQFDLIWSHLLKKSLWKTSLFMQCERNFLAPQNPSPHRDLPFTQYFIHYRISSNKTLFAIFFFPIFTMLLFFSFF